MGFSFGPIAITSAILNCKGFKYSDAIYASLFPPFPANAIPSSFPQTKIFFLAETMAPGLTSPIMHRFPFEDILSPDLTVPS